MFRDIVSRRGLPPDVVIIDGSGNVSCSISTLYGCILQDQPRIPRGRKGIRQDLADFLPNNPRPVSFPITLNKMKVNLDLSQSLSGMLTLDF